MSIDDFLVWFEDIPIVQEYVASYFWYPLIESTHVVSVAFLVRHLESVLPRQSSRNCVRDPSERSLDGDHGHRWHSVNRVQRHPGIRYRTDTCYCEVNPDNLHVVCVAFRQDRTTCECDEAQAILTGLSYRNSGLKPSLPGSECPTHGARGGTQ